MILMLIGCAVSVSGSLILGIHDSNAFFQTGVAPTQIAGVVLFVLLICAILVISDNIEAVFFPFLVLCVFACDCYNSFDVFVRFWWLVIPVAGSLAFHFIRYRLPVCIGKSIWGIVAVGAAILLGGVGTISAGEYFAPSTLYYTLSLSFGMIIAYLALRSQLERRTEYDKFEKFAEIMYALGIFVCLEMLWHYMIRLDVIVSTGDFSVIQQKNNFSTFLLFALPYPLFFARRNRLHLLSELLMLICIFFSGSRGGFVSAVVLLPFLIFYFMTTASGARTQSKGARSLVAAVAVPLTVAVCVVTALFTLEHFGVITHDEPRYRLISRALDAFRQNPLFGTGLGSTANVDIYLPKKGALYWYHSLPLQLIGSLGITGVAAYTYQALGRMLQITRRLTAVNAAMGLSYLGILIMSCFNPGEFVPIPYELMVVATFAMVEACDKGEAVAVQSDPA